MGFSLKFKRKKQLSARPRYSIRLKVMLGVVLVLTTMAASLGLRLQQVDMSERLRAHQDRIEQRLETIARSETRSFSEKNTSKLNQIMKSLVDDEGVVFIAALDSHGKILASGFGAEMFSAHAVVLPPPSASTPTPTPTSTPESEAIAAFRIEPLGNLYSQLQTSLNEYSQDQNASVFDYLIPGTRLQVSTEKVERSLPRSNVRLRVGRLIIGHDTAYLNPAHAIVRAKIWMTIVVVTALTAIVAWVLTHLLIQPIYRLIEATQAIAEERFDSKVELRSHDELRLLADSVNTMSDKLRDSKEKIAAINRNLEDQVRQRTEKLRRAYDELQVLDRMKDGFLSSISHEIRTPISSVKAFAEILINTPDISREENLEFLQIIMAESSRLDVLVNKMFELVKLESGEMPFEFTPTRPSRAYEDAVAAVHEASEAKQIEFSAHLKEPPEPVFWDRSMIARVLQEILANAIEFSPSGARVEVQCTSDSEQKLVTFLVRDHGPGIPSEALETVFEKFRQMGGTLTDKPQGTGLGLPVCRRITEAHSGKVYARRPDEGVGACIVVELPWLPAAAIRTAAEPRPSEAGELELCTSGTPSGHPRISREV